MFRGGFFPAGRVLGSAISAIDLALWDIQGKALGVPVFQLLGGRVRDRVVCYPHSGGKTPEELAYGKLADAEIVGSFDAIRWVQEAHVVPVGLDLSRYEPAPAPDNRRVRVVHAPTSRQKKGTDWIVEACKQLSVELDIVEDVRHDHAIERYRQADIVVDQLNAGWYGVFAIEAMALGKPVLTFLRDEAVRRTEEAYSVKVPLVHTTKETLAETLGPLVESAEARRRIGQESRAYVERVHDAGKVADRLIEIYRSL